MSNAGPTHNGRYSTVSDEKEMAAFDRLPRSVRDALNHADHQWAAYPIWRAWEAGRFKDAKAVVKAIKRADREVNDHAAQAAGKGTRRCRS